MSRPEVLFEGIADRIALEISKAQSSIYVAVAWLTDKKLFNALLEKGKQGVMVRLMISNDETSQKCDINYTELNQIGDCDVSLVKPEMGGLMHNKLCIIDRLTIITGSYNWTYSANKRNHENVFIFQDRDVAETCIRHFKEIIRRYLDATPKPNYQPKYKQNQNNAQQKTQQKNQNKPLNHDNKKIAEDYFNIASQHYDKKEYERAFDYFQKSAEQGHTIAQYYLGYMYANRQGVARDFKKALEWYQKSANQGYAESQYSLGYMYEFGHGVDKDKGKAMEWYQKSANQGYFLAQNKLDYMREYN